MTINCLKIRQYFLLGKSLILGHNCLMILYRAMTEEEFFETMKRGEPHFIRRFKFFAPDIAFIKNRVLSGEFAHGKFKPQKYQKVIAYEIPDSAIKYLKKLNHKEIMCDVRLSHMISWKVMEVTNVNEKN